MTIIPLASWKKKIYLPAHVLMEADGCPKVGSSMVLAEQLTNIGKFALKSFVGRVSEDNIQEVERAVEAHLSPALYFGPDAKPCTVCKGV